MTPEQVNDLITTYSVATETISDGYHTFGELYEHRNRLFITLCKTIHYRGKYGENVWRSKLHSDGSSIEGWFLLGIADKAGDQITYHLPMKDWDQTWFARERERAPEWDGHTSNDVLERLKVL